MNWQQEKATNLTLNLGGGIYKLQTFCEKKQALTFYQYSKTYMIKEKQLNFCRVLFRSSIRPCAAARF